MRNYGVRFLAVFLSLFLCFTSFDVRVFAEESDKNVTDEIVSEETGALDVDEILSDAENSSKDSEGDEKEDSKDESADESVENLSEDNLDLDESDGKTDEVIAEETADEIEINYESLTLDYPEEVRLDTITRKVEAYTGETGSHESGFPIIAAIYFKDETVNYPTVAVKINSLKINDTTIEKPQTPFIYFSSPQHTYMLCLGYYNDELNTGNNTVSADVSFYATTDTEYENPYTFTKSDKTTTTSIAISGTVTANKSETLDADEIVMNTIDERNIITEDYSEKAYDSIQTYLYLRDKTSSLKSVEIYKSKDDGNYSDSDLVGTGKVYSFDYEGENYIEYNKMTHLGTYYLPSDAVVDTYENDCVNYNSAVKENTRYWASLYFTPVVDTSKLTSEDTYLDLVVTMTSGAKYYSHRAFLNGEDTANYLATDLYGCHAVTDFDGSYNTTYKTLYSVIETNNFSGKDNGYITEVFFGKGIDGTKVPYMYVQNYDDNGNKTTIKKELEYDESDPNCISYSDEENGLCYVTYKKTADYSTKDGFFSFDIPEGTVNAGYMNRYLTEEYSAESLKEGMADLPNSSVTSYATEYTAKSLRLRITDYGKEKIGNITSAVFKYNPRFLVSPQGRSYNDGSYYKGNVNMSTSLKIEEDDDGYYIDIPSSDAIYKAYSSMTLPGYIRINDNVYITLNPRTMATSVGMVSLPNSGTSWKLCKGVGDSIEEVIKVGDTSLQGTTTTDNQVIISPETAATLISQCNGEMCRLFTTVGGKTTYQNLYFDSSIKTINLDADGGTFADGTVTTFSKKLNETYGSLPTPTKTGYTFAGYVDSKGSTITSKSKVNFSGSIETLTATWKINTATIVFNGNGGSGKVKNITVEYDANFADRLPNSAFKRTGYTFSGWSWKPNSAEPEYAPGASNISVTPNETGLTYTLYAMWTPKTYKVVLHANNASATAGTLTLAEGEEGLTVSAGENIYLTGREFVAAGKTISGWATSATSTKVAYNNGTISTIYKDLEKAGKTSIDLYAVWSTGKYVITYDLGVNGKCKGVTGYTYSESKDVKLTAPTRAGYNFEGWTVSGDGLSSLTGSVNASNVLTATAVSGKNTYFILPKKTEGDITLTAIWIPVNYAVKFDATDISDSVKTALTASPVDCNYEGNNIESNTVAVDVLNDSCYLKSGYTLTGYSTGKNGKGIKLTKKENGYYSLAALSTKAKAVVTVYPTFKLDTYTITYDLNGGKAASKNQASYNVTTKKVSIKNPTRTGWTFDGWEITSGTITNKTESAAKALSFTKGNTGDIALKAKWKSNGDYKVKIDPNGGTYNALTSVSEVATIKPSGASEDGEITESNPKIKVLYSAFTKADTTVKKTTTKWELKGLCTTKNGKGVYASLSDDGTYFTFENMQKNASDEVVLYAIWQKKTCKITYTAEPDIAMTNKNSTSVLYGSTTTLKNPSAKGYTFTGWYDGSGNKVTSFKATSNATYKAKFTPITYTIKINPNGATNSKSAVTLTCNYDSSYDLSSYATTYVKSGYIFTGFSTKKSGKVMDYTVKNLTTKNNATVNLYAVWEKATVSKISKVTAVKTDEGIYVTFGAAKGTVDKYYVQYSSKPDMSSAVSVSTTETNALIPATTDDVTNLTEGTTYYIRVRESKVDSTGDCISGQWSDVKVIKY